MAFKLALGVNTDELRAQAQQVEATVESVQAQLVTALRILAQTSYWRGEAANLHHDDMASRSEEIQAMIQRLKTYPVDIRRMAGLYDEAEQENLGMSNQLTSDIPLI